MPKPGDLQETVESLLKRRKQKEPHFKEPPLGRATPHWMMRIELIKERISKSDWQWFDRRAIQIMFDVSSATGGRILKQLKAPCIGNARAIHRDDILKSIQALMDNPRWQQTKENDDARWKRITELRNPARVVRYGPPITEPYRIANLPAGIELNREVCTIRAGSYVELYEKLIELAMLLTHGGKEEVERIYE